MRFGKTRLATLALSAALSAGTIAPAFAAPVLAAEVTTETTGDLTTTTTYLQDYLAAKDAYAAAVAKLQGIVDSSNVSDATYDQAVAETKAAKTAYDTAKIKYEDEAKKKTDTYDSDLRNLKTAMDDAEKAISDNEAKVAEANQIVDDQNLKGIADGNAVKALEDQMASKQTELRDLLTDYNTAVNAYTQNPTRANETAKNNAEVAYNTALDAYKATYGGTSVTTWYNNSLRFSPISTIKNNVTNGTDRVSEYAKAVAESKAAAEKINNANVYLKGNGADKEAHDTDAYRGKLSDAYTAAKRAYDEKAGLQNRIDELKVKMDDAEKAWKDAQAIVDRYDGKDADVVAAKQYLNYLKNPANILSSVVKANANVKDAEAKKAAMDKAEKDLLANLGIEDEAMKAKLEAAEKKAEAAEAKAAELEAKLTTKTATPTGVKAVAGTGKATISWKAVSGAKKYRVYRANAVDGTYIHIGTTSQTSYIDSTAKAGKKYAYKVRGIKVPATGVEVVGSASAAAATATIK